MPTPLEKRTVINAMRSADLSVRVLQGQLRIVRAHLRKHGWHAESLAESALLSCEELEKDLDSLHDAIYNEAIDRQEDAPDDDVIEPRSGGGSKGGGGG